MVRRKKPQAEDAEAPRKCQASSCSMGAVEEACVQIQGQR